MRLTQPIVCAVASRFYDARPDLHPKLSDLARKLAFQVPARGYKSVEIVQAYLINTLWGCGPVQRYEQDQTWLLLGMAIRYVVDRYAYAIKGPRSQNGATTICVCSPLLSVELLERTHASCYVCPVPSHDADITFLAEWRQISTCTAGPRR